jgi:capsular polysaccharide biosynthesis protein
MMQLRPSDALAALRQYWWVVLIAAVAAAAFALLYARLQTPIYRSSVRLELSGRFDYGAQLTVERSLRPLAQRVRTTEVAREVDQRLRLDLGPERLLGKVRAEAIVDNVQVLVEVDDTDPVLAERLAVEFARVFEEQHAARNLGLPQSERTVVAMLDRPTAASLIWPQTRAIVPVATALGAALGALLALLLAYANDTIKTADDVSRRLQLATLALIPAPAGAISRQLRQSQAGSVAAQGSPT